MKFRHRVLGFLAVLSAITYLDRVCISVAGPRMQEELGIGPEGWGWVTGVFAVAYGAFEMPSGYFADRFGPRRMLTRIVLWWSAFTALTGFVSSYPALLASRFLFGAGEAGAYPNTSVSISRWFPVSQRAGAFGIVWMASQAGAALSGLLVVPIQIRYGWRVSFYLFGLLGVIWAGAWFLWYRDDPAWKQGVAAGEFEESGNRSIRERHPLPLRTAFRSRNLWAILFVALAYCYAMYFFLAWLPIYLVRARGFGEKDLLLAAFPFIVGALSNAAGGFASDALVRRFGLRRGRGIAGSAGLAVAAFCILGAVFASHKYLTLALLGLGYAGITFQQPAVWAVCLDVGRDHAGFVSGAMNTAGQVGSFLLSVSYGYLVAATGSYDIPLLVVAAMLLAGVLVWRAIDPAELLSRPAVTSS